MHVVAVIIAVAWIAFWVAWLAAAATGVRSGRTRWGHYAGFRVAIVVIVLLVLRAGAFRAQTVTNNPWLQGVGLAIFVTGLALAIWARLYIGRNWGPPMSQKVDPELVTTGPYRWVRHPIYSGIILAMIGTAVAINWFWLIAAALLGGYFVYSARIEEGYMARRFPDTYPEYKRSTKMLLPFVL